MLKRKYNKDKSKTNWLRFRNQRNIVTNMRKKSMRCMYMQNKCNDARTGGGFWEAVKPLISHKYMQKMIILLSRITMYLLTIVLMYVLYLMNILSMLLLILVRMIRYLMMTIRSPVLQLMIIIPA